MSWPYTSSLRLERVLLGQQVAGLEDIQMQDTLWPIARTLAIAVFACVQIFFGIDLAKLDRNSETQNRKVGELSTRLHVQEVQIEGTIAQHVEMKSAIRSELRTLIKVTAGDDDSTALRLAEDARGLAESYRRLLLDRTDLMDARETELRGLTSESRREAAEAIAELHGMKATLEQAARDARFAAAEANASPRYVMVESGSGPAAFWLPHHGEFQATLEDVVEDGTGSHVAHVVVQAGADAPFQLRLGEFTDFQALPETGWAVRPALVHDSRTLFGRRHIVILEMIPDHLPLDPVVSPVVHSRTATTGG